MANLDAELARRRAILDRLKKGPRTYNPALDDELNLDKYIVSRSNFDDIKTDPRLQEAEYDTLSGLGDISKNGYTIEEMAAMNKLRSQANADDNSRRQAILQNMRMRGSGGSGAELAAQLQSADSAAARQSQSANDIAAAGQRRQLEALMQRGRMAGDMQGRSFDQQSRQAQAKDQLNQFNSRVAQDFYNNRLNAQNRAMSENTAAQNKWDWDQSELDYTDATQDMNRKIMEEQQRKEAKRRKRAAMGAVLGGVAGGVGGAMLAGPGGAAAGASAGSTAGMGLGSNLGDVFSDERLKEDKQDLDSDDIEQFIEALRPMRYRFKGDGDGDEMVGVMAQDLEGNEIGDKIVYEDQDDVKKLDSDNLLGAILAAIAHLDQKKENRDA